MSSWELIQIISTQWHLMIWDKGASYDLRKIQKGFSEWPVQENSSCNMGGILMFKPVKFKQIKKRNSSFDMKDIL